MKNSLERNKVSGIKRNAIEIEEKRKNRTSNQWHKRKFFGEELTNKLAKLFREKIINRRNKRLGIHIQEEQENLDDSESKSSSQLETHVKKHHTESQNSRESRGSFENLNSQREEDDEEIEEPIKNTSNFLKRQTWREKEAEHEDKIRNFENLPEEVEPYKLGILRNKESQMEFENNYESSHISHSGGKSARKQRTSSKYCGKKKTLENKRNRNFNKLNIHAKLAQSIYSNNFRGFIDSNEE